MEDETGEMSDGVVRQRRNLILVSVFIMMMSLGGIEISNDPKMLGINLYVHQNKSVFVLMWIVFGYFWWRYFQYSREVLCSSLRQERDSKMNDLCRDFLVREAANEHRIDVGNVRGEFAFSGLSRESFWVRKGYVQNSLGANDEYRVNILWLIPEIIHAWLFVIFKGTSFTDYVVPHLIALAALCIGISADWNGALPRIL